MARVAGRAAAGRTGRLAFIALATGLAAALIAGEWAGISAALGRLEPGWVAGSLGCLLAGLVIQMWLWRTVLAGLGSPLHPLAAARVYYLGQLGKYLPGSVWSALAQMTLARDHGVPRHRSGLAFVLLMAYLAAGGGLLACAVLPAQAGGAGGWLAVPVLVAAATCLVHPGVIGRTVGVILRQTGRRPTSGAARDVRPPGRHSDRSGGRNGPPVASAAPDTPLTWHTTIWSTVITTVHWVVLGVSVWLLALGLGAPPARSLVAAVGGFALAWSAGVLVVFAPAGAGVRELVLVGALLPVLDRADAITVAVLSRVGTIAVDLGLAGLALLAGRGGVPAPAGRPGDGSVRG